MHKVYLSVLTTDSYLPGVLVVNYCLRMTGTKIPFNVCVTDQLSSLTLDTLDRNSIITLPIKTRECENLDQDRKYCPTSWKSTFTKLEIFDLTRFDKIVYLDADMLICDNLDHLFDKPHFSAVNAGGFKFKDWLDLNSGLLVIEPSCIFRPIVNTYSGPT